MSQPIILYSHASGPNPWKVAILLEELGLAYKTEFQEFPDLKKEPYESINPNGRYGSLSSFVPSVTRTLLTPFQCSCHRGPQHRHHSLGGNNLRPMLHPKYYEILTSHVPVWSHHRVPHRNLRQG